jgi:hypothetical protein
VHATRRELDKGAGVNIQRISLSAKMLRRGFWLCVWKISTTDDQTLHYVGRTGDSSSLKAQSPFARISGHLGSNKHADTLQQHLRKRKLAIENCVQFEMIPFGPIYDEADGLELHRERRDVVAALESKLCAAMAQGEYDVLNTVNSKKVLDPTMWLTVRTEFVKTFPKLGH